MIDGEERRTRTTAGFGRKSDGAVLLTDGPGWNGLMSSVENVSVS